MVLSKRLARLCRAITGFVVAVTLVGAMIPVKAYAAAPTVSYRVHAQTYGWMPWKTNGKMAGTTGQAKRVEALQVKASSSLAGSVSYRVHMKTSGWSTWKSNGKTAGSTGQSKRIEAVQIKLTGNLAKKYDVYYRVHVAKVGWLGWAKNGRTAGSTGMANQMEAIQIKLVSKTLLSKPTSTTVAQLKKQALTVKAHVQSKGWLSAVGEGKVAGTTGQQKRLEALKLYLPDLDGKGNVIWGQAYVSGVGWQSWKKNGAMAGTTGQGKAIEAVRIKLDPKSKYGKIYDIYYRTHVQTFGWLGWAKNGASAGTTKGGLRAEAIQIKLVPKNQSMSTDGAAYIDASKTTAIHLKHHLTCSLCQHDYGSGFSGGGCMAMSYTVGLSILGVGNYSPTTFFYGGECHPDKGHIKGGADFDAKSIYDNLKAGKPTLVHYEFPGGQHWVCVTGVRSGVIINRLQPSDFTVLDPGNGREVALDACGGFGSRTSLKMKLMY